MAENDPGLLKDTFVAATVTRGQVSRTGNAKDAPGAGRPVTAPEVAPDGTRGAKRDRANLFCSMAALEPDLKGSGIALVRLGNKPSGNSPGPVGAHPSKAIAASADAGSGVPATSPALFQVSRANGVSRVTKDGYFHGDYFKDGRAWDSVKVARNTDKFLDLLKGA